MFQRIGSAFFACFEKKFFFLLCQAAVTGFTDLVQNLIRLFLLCLFIRNEILTMFCSSIVNLHPASPAEERGQLVYHSVKTFCKVTSFFKLPDINKTENCSS